MMTILTGLIGRQETMDIWSLSLLVNTAHTIPELVVTVRIGSLLQNIHSLQANYMPTDQSMDIRTEPHTTMTIAVLPGNGGLSGIIHTNQIRS